MPHGYEQHVETGLVLTDFSENFNKKEEVLQSGFFKHRK
jgi:hypothetical protein